MADKYDLTDMSYKEMKQKKIPKKLITAEFRRRRAVEKAHRKGKHLKTIKLSDLYDSKLVPTDEELKAMDPDLVAKVRGGYDRNGKPLDNPVFLDRMGNPVVKDGDFVYQGYAPNTTAYDKSGKKYSPPTTGSALTPEELEAQNRIFLKEFPEGTELLKDGRLLLPDNTILKRSSQNLNDRKDVWVEDSNDTVMPREPDTNETDLVFGEPVQKWKKDFTRSKVRGHSVANANKNYNEMTSGQLQELLSKVHDRRIYRDKNGKKYQLGKNGSKKYLKNQNQPTSYLYGGPSKVDPDIVKFGVGRYGVEERYTPGLAKERGKTKNKRYGWSSGEEGIDSSRAFMNWELPREIAENVEKYIHGNFGDISSRIMFDDDSLFGVKKRKKFGSGSSEYYDRKKMPLFNLKDENVTEPLPMLDPINAPLNDKDQAEIKKRLDRLKNMSGLEKFFTRTEPIKSENVPRWLKGAINEDSIANDVQVEANRRASREKLNEEDRKAQERHLANTTALGRTADYVAGLLPYPLNSIGSMPDDYKALMKIRKEIADKGAGSVMKSIGKGAIGEFADVVGDDAAARWWRENDPNSQAGSVGAGLSDELMLAAAGGALGKAGGSIYRRLRRLGEAYNRKVAQLARRAEKSALKDPVLRRRVELGTVNKDANIDIPYNPPLTKAEQRVKRIREHNDKAGLPVDMFTHQPKEWPRDVANEVKRFAKNLKYDAGEELRFVKDKILRRTSERGYDLPYKRKPVGAGSTGSRATQKQSLTDMQVASEPVSTGVYGGNKVIDDEVAKQAALIRQRVAEQVAKSEGTWYPDAFHPIHNPTTLQNIDFVRENLKRRISPRSMLEKNNEDLNQLWSQIGDLNKARRAMRESWDQYPYLYGQGGAMAGLYRDPEPRSYNFSGK